MLWEKRVRCVHIRTGKRKLADAVDALWATVNIRPLVVGYTARLA